MFIAQSVGRTDALANTPSTCWFLPREHRQTCIGVYNEQVHAFLSMHESTIAAAKALAKAIIDNGDLEEIRIYNLTENLTDFLEDYEED